MITNYVFLANFFYTIYPQILVNCALHRFLRENYLKEGDFIFLGDDKLEVIHAPGHSPGSICFYCEKQQFIIGGDVLFQNSIGRTDLPYGNHEDLLKNIKEKLFKLPENVKVYPGHGPETTIGNEIKENPFLQA